MSLHYNNTPIYAVKTSFFSSSFILLITLILLFVLSDAGLTQWTSSTSLNTPVVTAGLNQEFHDMISDGSGGVIIAWRDGRNGTSNYNIYAQRLDANGNAMWNTNGVAICTSTGNQNLGGLVSDDNGGAIITWSDYRNGNSDIYAQRINGSGVVQWTANGLAICTNSSNQYSPFIVRDMNGGAIIAWNDNRGNQFIYAQRINAAGTTLWTANGAGVTTVTGNRWLESMVSDNQSGAVLAFRDYNNTHYDVHAQHINSSGVIQWDAYGMPICTAAGDQQDIVMSMNYTGIVMAWRDDRNGASNSDIYAQRIKLVFGPELEWGTNGVAVCTATGEQYLPSITTPFMGAAVIAWADARNGSSNMGIYAQKINAGVAQWTANGVALCTASREKYDVQITMNGISYESVVTWQDNRSFNGDIYVQSIDNSGNIRWATNGILLSNASGSQRKPLIIKDAANGTIISWIDERTGSTSQDIYSMHLNRSGILSDTGDPSAPTGLTATASASIDKRITLNWTASTSGDVTGYMLYRHTASFSDTTNRKIASLGKVSSYNDNTPSYGTFYYRVYAVDGAGRKSLSSNITSQSAPDHQNPNPPTSLSATASETIEKRINLSWTVSSSGDVTNYRIYRHTSAIGSDTTNKRIATVAALSSYSDTPATFGTFYYRVYARDGSGNMSSGSNEISQSNLYAQPGSQPANFQFTGRSTSGLSVSFDAAPGSPDGYIALRRSGGAPSGVPADGTSYSAGNMIGDGQVVYTGNATGFNDSGLNPATAYYYKIFAYNGEAIHVNYLTSLAPLAGNTVTLALQPANQPTQLTFFNITNNSFSASFKSALDEPTGYLVLRNSGSVPSFVPSDGTAYTESQILGDSYVSYIGPDTTFEESGLAQGTYFYAIYAYNGTGSSINYLTVNPLQNNQSTLVSEPTNQATNLVFSNIAETSLSVSFTPAAGNPSGYIILRSASASPAGIPVDGTSYTVGQNIGSDVVVNVGAAITFNDGGLSPDTRYYYDVISYNGSGGTINYLTSQTPLEGNRKTIALSPTDQPTNLSFSDVTNSSFAVSFSAAANGAAGYIALRRNGNAPTAVPIDGTVYTQGTNLGDSEIAYIGSGTSFQESGLAQGTYFYTVFAYNGNSESINYFTSNPLAGNQSTLVTEPTNQPSNPAFSSITSQTFTLTFTAASGNPTGYLVLRRTAQAPQSTPVDGTSYSVGQTLDQDVVAYVGSALSFNQTGLSPNTVYHYNIYSYNGSGSTINYLTSQVPLKTSQTTLALNPVSQPTNISFSNRTSSAYTVSFNPAQGTPAGYLALRRKSASPTALPVGGSSYSQGEILGDATVAYIGNQTAFNESGLEVETEYYYDILSYNGSGGSINFLAINPLEGSETTLTSDPTTQPTNITFSAPTDSSFVLGFSDADPQPAGYIVLMQVGDYPASIPEDGEAYSVNDILGNSIVVSFGNSTNIPVENLAVDNTYYFRIFSFNGAGRTTNYLSTLPLEGFKAIVRDVLAPVVTNVILSPTVPDIGTNVIITAQVSDNNALASVNLYYKNLNRSTFDPSVKMNNISGSDFQGIIPASVVSISGFDYKIEARDVSGNINNYTASNSVKIPADTISTGNITGNPYQTGFPESEWHMISIPLKLDNPEVGDVLSSFGSPGEHSWKLFDSEANDVSQSASFTSGKSFWLKQLLGQGAREIKLAGGSSPTLDDGNIILLEGWNQIGNPYSFPIDWLTQTNSQENPNIKGPIRWDGKKYAGVGQTMGLDTSLTELLPWEGYFVYNGSNTSQILEINPNKNLGSGKLMAKTGSDKVIDWKINISAQIDGYVDDFNYIGTALNAESGNDQYDLPELPVIGEFISVYFLSPEDDNRYKKSTIDFQPITDEGHSWDMEIVSNIKDKSVQLDWTCDGLAENISVKIIDMSHNRVISDPTKLYSYKNRFPNHPVRFRVLAGTESYVTEELEETLSSLPNKFELRQNYPNPFNGETKIAFSLQELSRISLAIYNVLGQKVRTIEAGRIYDSGSYDLAWDARNDSGYDVSSGIYFAVLQAESKVARIKLVLVR